MTVETNAKIALIPSSCVSLPECSMIFKKRTKKQVSTRKSSRCCLRGTDVFTLVMIISASVAVFFGILVAAQILNAAKYHHHSFRSIEAEHKTKISEKSFERLFHSFNRILNTKSGFNENIKQSKRHKLVVAGKLSVYDSKCDIGQMNLMTGVWNMSSCVRLTLYNSYQGGEVYLLSANQSSKTLQESWKQSDLSGMQNDRIPSASTRPNDQLHQVDNNDMNTVEGIRQGGEKEVIVVGAFDTTYHNSREMYCSVGKWDGYSLSKVGDGLCASALYQGMKITTTVIADSYDMFIAGSFNTQVWNSKMHEFLKIYDVAHFDASQKVWLPLVEDRHFECIPPCSVSILALAWDSSRSQLHVGGRFNAINGVKITSGLAIFDAKTRQIVSHPAGGLMMKKDRVGGVVTALQLDERNGILYVLGSFELLAATGALCDGIAAYEIPTKKWTCLADPRYDFVTTSSAIMMLTPYGIMVSGKTTNTSTWEHRDLPYTIALLSTSIKETIQETNGITPKFPNITNCRVYRWSWLPGFSGHYLPIHTLSNGYDEYTGVVFIGGDNIIARWSYEPISDGSFAYNAYGIYHRIKRFFNGTIDESNLIPVTRDLSGGGVAKGVIMSISQLVDIDIIDLTSKQGSDDAVPTDPSYTGYIIISSGLAIGICLFGLIVAVIMNRREDSAMLPISRGNTGESGHPVGLTLDLLGGNANVHDIYSRAMRNRFVEKPIFLSLINPSEIYLHRIIGEGTFGRVWSAKWRSSGVAVKEFVFAQAAVAGRSTMREEIIDEIVGEAGMMAILRHPNVLQLFGCALTDQAIWIVSELCSLGSLRQLLDSKDKSFSLELRLQLALHVAEGMLYLHNQNPAIIHRDLKSHNIFIHETFTEANFYDYRHQFNRRKDELHSEKQQETQTLIQSSDENEHKPDYGTVSHQNFRHSREMTDEIITESTIVAKIGDWGSARAALTGSRTMTHGVGTACWLAPEVIMYARSSKSSDVYSFAIVLWELATQKDVYPGLEATQIIARVASDDLRPDIPDDCLWKDIMVQSWDKNPENRPSFEDIVIELNNLKVNFAHR